jgi:hypothetical protein
MIWVMRKKDTETNILIGFPISASCVQKSDDSRFCNSHCLSHFAAFFIVMGTKISIVENLVLLLSLVMLLCVIKFVFAATAALHKATLLMQLKAWLS